MKEVGATYRKYRVVDAFGKTVFETARLNDLRVKGAGDGLMWHSGAAPFTIFCAEEGDQFGFIGSSDSLGFVNDNVAPDLGCLLATVEA
jgi:hypothetical protein